MADKAAKGKSPAEEAAAEGNDITESASFRVATTVEKARWDAIMDGKFNLEAWMTISGDLLKLTGGKIVMV